MIKEKLKEKVDEIEQEEWWKILKEGVTKSKLLQMRDTVWKWRQQRKLIWNVKGYL